MNFLLSEKKSEICNSLNHVIYYLGSSQWELVWIKVCWQCESEIVCAARAESARAMARLLARATARAKIFKRAEPEPARFRLVYYKRAEFRLVYLKNGPKFKFRAKTFPRNLNFAPKFFKKSFFSKNFINSINFKEFIRASSFKRRASSFERRASSLQKRAQLV